MPNKLTDKEIVKKFQLCTLKAEHPGFVLCGQIVDLINRLQCERNKYRRKVQNQREEINRLQAEKEELQELVNEMSDYFPACIGCEGKTEDGVRTDKCVFLIDKTNYCVKRGISNIVAIRKENAELKAENERLKEEKSKIENKIDEIYPLVMQLPNAMQQTKAEAYKEVFEKLNDKSIRSKAKVKGCGFLYVSVVTLHDIYKLKKELVGEDK